MTGDSTSSSDTVWTVVAIVGTAFVAIASVLGASRAVLVPATVAVALVAARRELEDKVVRPSRRQDEDRRRRHDQALEPLHRLSQPTTWPTAAVLSADPLQIGVRTASSRTDGYPPYLPRDIDDELDRAVAECRLVVVTGPRLIGASRTALEAARRTRPDSPLLAPRSHATAGPPLHGLAEALEHLDPVSPERSAFASPLAPAVVWLDDLGPRLEQGDLDDSVLVRMERVCPGFVAVGTLDSTTLDVRRRRDWEVLRALPTTREVELRRRLSATEVRRAQQLYPDDVDQPCFRSGPAEYLVAAQALYEWYCSEECPAGTAVVRAAVQWHRAGMRRPIALTDLQQLAALHEPRLADDREVFEAALAWASRPLQANVPLLMLFDDGGRQALVPAHVAEYIAARELESVASEALDLAAVRAEPGDAVEVALAAARYGRPDRAWRLLDGSSGLRSGHETLQLLAALEGSDAEQAGRYYRELLADSSEDVAAVARLRLGALALSAGRHEEGQALLAATVDAGLAVSAQAAVLLGEHLAEQGDAHGALRALHIARATGDAAVVAQAALALADLYERAGERDAAVAVLESARAAEEPRVAARAAVRLAHLLLSQRRPQEALQALADLAELDESGEALAVRASACLRVGRPREALRHAENALRRAAGSRLDPPQGTGAPNMSVVREARCTASLALLDLGYPERALKEAEEAVRVAPRDVLAWSIKSRAARHIPDLALAGDAARRTMALAPEGAFGPLALAQVALAQRQLGSARSWAQRAVERAPDDPTTWQVLAHVHVAAGHDEDAFLMFAEVLARDPEHSEPYDPPLPLDLIGQVAVSWQGGRPSDRDVLPEAARAMLADAWRMRRAVPIWQPLWVGLALSLGVVWLSLGVGAVPERSPSYFTAGLGLLALAVAMFLLVRWVRARRQWRRVPAAHRDLLCRAGHQSRARELRLPIGGAVALAFGVAFAVAGDPLLILPGAALILGGAWPLSVWVLANSRRSSGTTWVADLRRERWARRRSPVVLGVALLVLAVSVTIDMLDEGVHAAGVVGAVLYAAVGSWLLIAWVRARRALRAQPGGVEALRRLPADELVLLEPETLVRRARSWQLPLAGGLLLFVAGVGLQETVAGDPAAGVRPWDPGSLLTAVGIGSLGLWMLWLWWSARRLLRRSPERGRDTSRRSGAPAGVRN